MRLKAIECSLKGQEKKIRNKKNYNQNWRNKKIINIDWIANSFFKKNLQEGQGKNIQIKKNKDQHLNTCN
jgi:hypothetical protein